MSSFLENGKSQQWPALRLFSLYRFAVSVIFLILSLFSNYLNFLVSHNPLMLRWASGFYVLFSITALVCPYFRWIPYKLQVYSTIIIDIAAITLLMHLYGGISSGFGTLMIAVVAGGSLLLPDKSALLFASLAALSILLHEIYTGLHSIFEKTAYTQA